MRALTARANGLLAWDRAYRDTLCHTMAALGKK